MYKGNWGSFSKAAVGGTMDLDETKAFPALPPIFPPPFLSCHLPFFFNFMFFFSKDETIIYVILLTLLFSQ